MRKLLLLCGAAVLSLLLMLLTPLQADAHAQYDHSNPPANAHLPAGHPPATVQIWFTEQIEPAFSRIEVYNQARQRVDRGDSHLAPDSPYSLIVSLRPALPDGAYTAVFRNVSKEDGHEVTGSFSFVVGAGPLPTNTNDLLQQASTADENFNLWSIGIRWLNYLAMAGLVGSLTFLLLVWQPGVRRLTSVVGKEMKLAEQRMQKRTMQAVLWTLLLLLAGWLAFLIYQASIVSMSAPWQVFTNGAFGALLFRSHFGTVWLARLLLIILVGLLWWLRVHAEEQWVAVAYLWALLLLGIAIMFTTSLNSHAAANRAAWLLVPADVLHQASTGFWIGGLLAFTLILPGAAQAFVPGTGDRTRLFAAIIPQFSQIALISVALLIVTGTLQAVVQLPALDLLWNSGYGRALLVKICIFIVLLGFGAYHLRKVSPRMRTFAASTDEERGAPSLAAGALQRSFSRSLRYEALVAVLLLLVVGALTSLSPPRPASSTSTASGEPGALIRQGKMADLTYRLAINPGTVGNNTFEVELKDANGQPVQKVDAVVLRFTMLDMDMGVQEVNLQPVAGKPGYYSTATPVLSMTGDWRLALLVRRPGFDDAMTEWQLTLP
ncbi:MAG: CopD family protein [Ktedonobacteraceae bacterium]|nr:CopD family protein [Ktedonobacteraceae bacterium]